MNVGIKKVAQGKDENVKQILALYSHLIRPFEQLIY